MSDSGERELPHQVNCVEYVTHEAAGERYEIMDRIFIDQDTGRMSDFYVELSDRYTHKVLISVDCAHRVAHYHDERNGHYGSPRYEFAPATTHNEIEAAHAHAMSNIRSFGRSKGIIL